MKRSQKDIVIKGARQNNLKNINVKIPREKFTAITGVSGSGKSSLAYDVIFGESQRRYIDSLSSYAKRFVTQLGKPDVDIITGLSPVVSLKQKSGKVNPRSTVGTMTEISDYMRLLYSTVGVGKCPYCYRNIPVKSPNNLAETITLLPSGTIIEILAPVFKIYGRDFAYLFEQIRGMGYRKFLIDDQIMDLSDKIELDENANYKISVIIDKFAVSRDIFKNIVEALKNAFKVGHGLLQLKLHYADQIDKKTYKILNEICCPEHHIVMEEMQPFYFSFNDIYNACPTCSGLGVHRKVEPKFLVSDEEKSINQGALKDVYNPKTMSSSWKGAQIRGLAKHYGFSLDVPFKDLPEKIKDILFYGSRGERFELIYETSKKSVPNGSYSTFEGYVNWLERVYQEHYDKDSHFNEIFDRVMVDRICPDCNGKRLRKQRLLVCVGEKNIHEMGEMSVRELLEFFKTLDIDREKRKIADPIINEIVKRLQMLCDIGLEYININQTNSSLSAGEIQRIRLCTQLGSELMGMLYILDEPSIGLHEKDCCKIIDVLKKITDIGNTVIVIEHDLKIISQADYIIELGPGAGIHGGYVIAQGDLNQIKQCKDSLTGMYLSKAKTIEVPQKRRSPNGKYLRIKGARENNLKNIDVDIPLGVFICITGVSGSGKSSLINEILFKKVHSQLYNSKVIPGEHDSIEGIENINNVIFIDQTPIGSSTRSNISTYIGLFDVIRDLFAETDEAREKGFDKSYFSIMANSKGRCDECSGKGIITTELQFMGDIETICPVCKGARFREEILEIRYNGKNISEVLEMSIEEATEFFRDNKLIFHKLDILKQLGVGYLKIGQPTSTLSGGEAQRIKLGEELGKIKRGLHNLYIMDEPTTGLHMDDIKLFLKCINKLVDAGHTVIIIEHNMDVIKTADYIIDMGPDGGKNGGRIVAEGTPEEVSRVSESYTGQFLKEYLERH